MDLFEKLPGAVLPWYQAHKRDLPWRQDRDPYHIHLSEIMLQQTRVEAVKGYYTRFLQALPTVEALAKADDEQLSKLWEGLGYYSRVRNLKKAAAVIVDRYGGKYPASYEKLLALPGVGPYTAGAISSIAFGLPVPAVDGNVLRVVSRLTNDETPVDDPAYMKQVRSALEKIYPANAGDFTQGLMELGATVCGPNRKPECESCPCNAFCRGFAENSAENLPKKAPKRQRRREQYTVFILQCGDHYAMQKRKEKGLLAGLWEFPNVPGTLETEEALEKVREMGLKVQEIRRCADKAHIFTHIQWDMRGVWLEVAAPGGCFTWLPLEEIRRSAALPTAFRQFLP